MELQGSPKKQSPILLRKLTKLGVSCVEIKIQKKKKKMYHQSLFFFVQNKYLSTNPKLPPIRFIVT